MGTNKNIPFGLDLKNLLAIAFRRVLMLIPGKTLIVVVQRDWYDLSIMESASQWAERLGLVMVNPFFPSASINLPGEHCAMLDGRRASFACSTVETPYISQTDSKNWQWSADLSHHVLVTPDSVHVRSGHDPVTRQFKRESVETRLEEFLTFLDSSRRSPLPDVVSFLVDEFRGIWSIVNGEGQDALAAFLVALLAAGERDSDVIDDVNWRLSVAGEIGIDASTLFAGDMGAVKSRARGMQARAPFGLSLVPSLVLRHAAGRLFQEAHSILESVQLGLFGDTASISTTPTYSPAGAYFTPVPIARLLADWALQRKSALTGELTIADYACGSAVFLTESLRALERKGYRGKVLLIGRDKSAQAVTMAKVAVHIVKSEMPGMEIATDISQGDAFDVIWPKADIVLMNPPFRSWERMNERERAWVHEVTKGVGRPDLSVGFVERAVQSLHPSGVIATLIPAGVLASDGLSKWRNALLQRATPSLVAVLGEHGLFQHALVNVGMLALENNAGAPLAQRPLHVAWSSADTGAASRAIRAVRRSICESNGTQILRAVADWSVTTMSLASWKQRPSWLPGAGALGSLLEAIQARTTTKVGDIFQVRQGIRTGSNEVFIQPRAIVETLPKREQLFFKESVDAASFVNGEIRPNNCLFVPDQKWQTESEVSRALPYFFSTYLQTRKESLEKRQRKSQDSSRWWELTWPRFWAFDGRPRLVSKRFGLYPAFARDMKGSFAVVQANAWIPVDGLASEAGEDAISDLLTAYWWMLNSRIMVALLREYCPNVAGGQLDLEHKYVKHVPLPHLSKQFQENPALQVLASSIRTRNADQLPSISDRDHFAAAAFGTDISEWNLSGLELPD